MAETLYNRQILQLATRTYLFPRLAQAAGSADVRSPLCGSRVALDVALNEEVGRGQAENATVSAIGAEVQACALGQASAALLLAGAAGRSAAQLGTTEAELAAYLQGARGDIPAWPEFELFAVARPHAARHPSILLPFKAVRQAIQNAMKKD